MAHMMTNNKRNDPQYEKFVKTARAPGCDESEQAFDSKLKALLTIELMTNEEVKKKAKKDKH